MYKAVCYAVPDAISRINILPMKDIEAELVVEDKTEESLLGRLKKKGAHLFN